MFFFLFSFLIVLFLLFFCFLLLRLFAKAFLVAIDPVIAISLDFKVSCVRRVRCALWVCWMDCIFKKFLLFFVFVRIMSFWH